MIRRPEALRGATIVGTGMYVPERRLTNAELERIVDTTDAWILERTGIRERHIAAPDQASSDLGLIAAQRALEMAGHRPRGRGPVGGRHHHARPLPALLRLHAAGQAGGQERGGLRPVRGLQRLHLRARHRPRRDRRRVRGHRAPGGRRGALAHHRLRGPQHLRAVRRRRRAPRCCAPARPGTASSRSPSTATASTATCSRSRRAARSCRPPPRPSRTASTS